MPQHDAPTQTAGPVNDVRGRGFPRRTALADATRWIDARTAPLPAETVPLAAAVGRVLAVDVAAPADRPAADRATRDGVAVRAEETLGAGAYAPVLLMAGAATPVAAGQPLPPGTDAVLPVEAAQGSPLGVEVLAPLAAGDGVERRGEEARSGAPLLPAGRVLRPQDVGLLAALGFDGVSVVRRPWVRVLVVGGPRDDDSGGGPDADGPLLAALVARDGGLAEVRGPLPADRAALAAALAEPGADVVLVCGRTGVGEDDVAPLALADAGTLAIHGVALRPGDSAGLGLAGSMPAVLLPGEPAACLAAYDLLGARAVRRCAGLDGRPPYAVVRRIAARKLVSEIGTAELYRVRLTADGGVEPLASAAVPGLAAAARADGFVLIPAESEGVAPGAPTNVWLYDPPPNALC
ncbi:molybdopterin molybdotransferase MoeA [Azospirillum sp.]|uniref:molybdopterin molybdotransferase MoeA n=1 Tax=Azospirillum sp. TaxID=34012 RepID=UPI002D73B079|nr:molybdopterin-binding protein [Azospirillum sp.]HYD65004.1 molybdopterin-binding protein [Azospirillum sp.]